MGKVRVYAYSYDGYCYMNVLSDQSLFERYEKFLLNERGIRYKYVEFVDGVIKNTDDKSVLYELDDFGY